MSKRAKEAALKSYPPKRKSEFLAKFAEMTGSIDTMPKNTLPPSKECEKGLREPLVNDDLEEAAKEFAKDAYPDKHNLVWMFKRGAKWQKEQDDEAYLNEKIAKATESWKGVDVDKMLAECRGYDEEPVCEELEEEISRYLREECSNDDEPSISEVARHFANWQKEKDDVLRHKEWMVYKSHLINDLNKAENEGYRKGKEDGIIVGKEQMMKEAVEAKVIESFNPVTTTGEPTMHGCTIIYEDENKPYLIAGDKVKLIIVKED